MVFRIGSVGLIIERRTERIANVPEYRRMLRALDRDLAAFAQDARELNAAQESKSAA